jgi:hypothetical protein
MEYKKEYRKETRIWCEMCKVFVYNNPIQRKKHDQSPKHVNLIKRQLKSIHKPLPIQKMKKKTIIDASKYGVEGFVKEENVKYEKSILETNIGEWEPVSEEEIDDTEMDTSMGTSTCTTMGTSTGTSMGLSTGIESIVNNSTVNDEFQVIEKVLKVQKDQEIDIKFIKRTKRNFRK